MSVKVGFLLLIAYVIYSGMSWSINRSVDTYNTVYSSPAAVTLKERERQLQCLTQNIYWEAASEPFEGKVAVAQVTLNRANHDQFPKDICQVVYQKNIFYNKIICQFSWYCENNHKIKPVYKPLYEESEAVAKKVLLEGFRLDGLKDAIYYHADYVNPKWRKEKIAVIGRHIFYKG
jgi:spore germination cell wall hydrolase CwlJ-like protein